MSQTSSSRPDPFFDARLLALAARGPRSEEALDAVVELATDIHPADGLLTLDPSGGTSSEGFVAAAYEAKAGADGSLAEWLDARLSSEPGWAWLRAEPSVAGLFGRRVTLPTVEQKVRLAWPRDLARRRTLASLLDRALAGEVPFGRTLNRDELALATVRLLARTRLSTFRRLRADDVEDGLGHARFRALEALLGEQGGPWLAAGYAWEDPYGHLQLAVFGPGIDGATMRRRVRGVSLDAPTAQPWGLLPQLARANVVPCDPSRDPLGQLESALRVRGASIVDLEEIGPEVLGLADGPRRGRDPVMWPTSMLEFDRGSEESR